MNNSQMLICQPCANTAEMLGFTVTEAPDNGEEICEACGLPFEGWGYFVTK